MPGQPRGNSFASDYIDVAARLIEFREKFPQGSLQPADPAKPYTIESIDGTTYIAVVAAAYRTADDTRPGIGMAYEVFPGKSNFTRGSELQNAETSAWGRAIVAALAADTKRGIASAEEVRNRVEERENPAPADPLIEVKKELAAIVQAAGNDIDWMRADFYQWSTGVDLSSADVGQLTAYRNHLRPEATTRVRRAS